MNLRPSGYEVRVTVLPGSRSRGRYGTVTVPPSSVRTWETASVRLESDEPILAGLDGEALIFESPLDITIRPKGLRVVIPRGTKPGYVSSGEAIAARLLDMAKTGGV